MSYHTPTGWRDRCTFYGDQNGPHQIRILGQLHLIVACACNIHTPLAAITTAEEALSIWRRHAELAGERAS